MIPNEDILKLEQRKGSTLNHLAVTHAASSSDHLDAEYTTCISNGPSAHELCTNKQKSKKNYSWARTFPTSVKRMPDMYFCHATTSYRNIHHVPGSLNPSSSSPQLMPKSHRSRLRRTRQRSIRKTHSWKNLGVGTRTNSSHTTKLFQRNAFRVGVSAEAKVIHEHDDTKVLDVNEEKSSFREKHLGSNGLGISMINVNMPPEKIDVYYFDHGTSGYYSTTDIAPILLSDKCVDKIDNAATRFWAEIFGTFHIGMTFVTAFILQLLRFILRSIMRPLIVGMIQMAADYAFKPFLTIIFNSIIQPLLIFLHNIATSFRDVCEPVAKTIGYFFREFANVLRAIRLIEINHQSATNSDHHHRMNERT